MGDILLLVCSLIHSSSSLGGRKIDGNINGNMNESNLQAPAASFWCMYTQKRGTWSYRGQERKMSQGQERKMSQFPDSQISCLHFGIKLKQLYQTYVLHVPIYSSHHLSPEQRISQIIVKTRLVFLLRGINGIRKTVKEMGFLVMKKWKEGKKVKFW